MARQLKMTITAINMMSDKCDIPLLDGWDKNIANMPPYIQALKETANEALLATGLPTTGWEDWKYTNIREIEKLNFIKDSIVEEIELPISAFDRIENALHIQLINSYILYNQDNIPNGVTIKSLEDSLEDEWVKDVLSNVGNFSTMPMEALNTAHLEYGFVIQVQKDVQVESPILIKEYIQNSNKDSYLKNMPRILILLEEGAEVTVIEEKTGSGKYIKNQTTNINLKDYSKLKHYTIQNDDRSNGYNFNTVRVNCSTNSIYKNINLNVGAKLSRSEIITDLLGSQIECIIRGAYCLGGHQHHSTTIKTAHFEPNSTSKQIYKGVIDNEASAVFQGKIHVHRNAEGTDGHQLNHALLLCDKAEVYAKPELEIYAEDVKCSHGATSGNIDKEALFYLQSRGIDKKIAKSLLTQGFLKEILEDIVDSNIKEIFIDQLEEVKI